MDRPQYVRLQYYYKTKDIRLKQFKVQRNESNFVWTSHSLIVELNHHSWWFWNAPEDAHGTTMNNLALKHPTSYKTYIGKENVKERAQWTRTFVIPHAVSTAHQREHAKLTSMLLNKDLLFACS